MNRDQLANLAAAATKGPWVVAGDTVAAPATLVTIADVPDVLDSPGHADAEFIAAARNYLPVLLRRLDLAEQALATLVAGLLEPGWCWHCGYQPGHRAECPVAYAGRVLSAIRRPFDTEDTP